MKPLTLPGPLQVGIAAIAASVAMPFIQKLLDAPLFISGTQVVWMLRMEPGCVLAGVDVK